MRNSLLLLLILLGACGKPELKEAAKEKAAAKPPDVFRVRFATTKGDFFIEVHREWAPNGAGHFYDLLQERFFDDSRFYRVVRRYVVQWGINKSPKVDQLWRQLEIPDDPPKQKNIRGTVAYAKSGPNTRTTQIFINLANNNALDAQGFVPFGRVVEGMEVVDLLAFVYGDVAPRGSGPDPKKIQTLGNDYLDREFPRLDRITSARIVAP